MLLVGTGGGSALCLPSECCVERVPKAVLMHSPVLDVVMVLYDS